MDLSKFKLSDWLKIGGAIGFLIFGFVHWASFHGFTGQNVFDYFFTGTIPWLLIIGTGVMTVLIAGDVVKAGNVPWTLIMLAATGLAALLVVIRLLVGPSESGIDLDRGVGLWLCTIAALVTLAGAIVGFRESGGEFSDLTDMSKLKGAFNTGGTTADAPPPPPAPPAPPASPAAPEAPSAAAPPSAPPTAPPPPAPSAPPAPATGAAPAPPGGGDPATPPPPPPPA